MKFKNRILIFIVVFSIVILCRNDSMIVSAATKPQLKGLKISWDLKNNKTYTYKTSYIQADSKGIQKKDIYKKGKITVKNYKVVNAKKSGYKKMTCTIIFKPSNFSQKQVENIGNWFEYGGTSFGGGLYVTAVDYKTGECLEGKNKHRVTFTCGKWKGIKDKKYTFDKGWFTEHQKCYVNITVTYPKAYKNLCVLAGGFSSTNTYCGIKKNQKIYPYQFFDKTVTFKDAKVLYSKKDKAFCHGMRVK